MSNLVDIRHLTKRFGTKSVLKDVSFSVKQGEFTVVFGLPVSGKSVLVRLIAGLETPDSGQIELRGRDMTRASPGERNLGYVPQSFALYPHFSVFDNIAYPLSLIKAPKEDIQREVQRAATLLKIEQFLDRKPEQLSGGQKQRVAIARGLVKKTDLFILDDPLVGLDFKLRERLIDDLRNTQAQLGMTFIYTTSEATEATQLAQQIAVLHEGEIVEHGAPVDLYERPARAATMRYLGFPQANMLRGELFAQGAGLRLNTPLFGALVQAAPNSGITSDAGIRSHDVSVGIRPEHIVIGPPPPGHLPFQAKVLLREDLGGEEIIYLDANGLQLTTVASANDANGLQVVIDQMVTAYAAPKDVAIFVHDRYLGRAAALST
jgi:ABC-type sugar transport system ATPase subunit